MTELLYLTDEARHCQATVTQAGDEPDPWVVLDQTCLHRAGGGQLADHGSFADRRITDVTLDGETGQTRHYLSGSGLAVGLTAELSVEPTRRDEHSVLHSAGHLIAALVEHRFPGLTAIKGHHWPGQCRVEFSGSAMPPTEQIQAELTTAISQAIQDDLPVQRLLNPDQPRQIAIGQYPPVGCGGTHVTSTQQLAALVLTGVRVKKGTLRVSYQLQDG